MPAQTKRISSFLDNGGVGKTTTSAHLGVALAEEGHDVLLIDLAGNQNDLAKQFGLVDELESDEDRWPNISTVFDPQWDQVTDQLPDAIGEMILDTEEGPDLIPAHEGLGQADNELGSLPVEERSRKLKQFLDNDIDPLGYDVVILDLPGAETNITPNGLVATQHVVAPMTLGAFEREQLSKLNEQRERVGDKVGVSIELSMIIPNAVDQRTNLDTELIDSLADDYPFAISPEPIVSSQDIRNAQSEGHTVFQLEEPSTTAERAIEAYRANAEELLTRVHKESIQDVKEREAA